MTRRLLALTALVPVLTFVGACSGRGDDETDPAPTDATTSSTTSTPSEAAPSDAPEQAVRDYLAALQTTDCDGVKAVVRQPDQIDCATLAEQKPFADPADADVTLAEQDGDSGVVVVVWPDESSVPELTFGVEQVEDDWKVVLNSQF